MLLQRIELAEKIEMRQSLAGDPIIEHLVVEFVPQDVTYMPIEVIRVPGWVPSLCIRVTGFGLILEFLQDYGTEIRILRLRMIGARRRFDPEFETLLREIADYAINVEWFAIVDMPKEFLSLHVYQNLHQIRASRVYIIGVHLDKQLSWLAEYCPVVQDLYILQATIDTDNFLLVTFENLTELRLRLYRFGKSEQSIISKFLQENLQINTLSIESENGIGTGQETYENGDLNTTTDTEFFRTLEAMPGLGFLYLKHYVLQPEIAYEWCRTIDMLRTFAFAYDDMDRAFVLLVRLNTFLPGQTHEMGMTFDQNRICKFKRVHLNFGQPMPLAG